MAKFYSVMDTEEVEFRESKEVPSSQGFLFDMRTSNLEEDTEVQTLQPYADDKSDYFDGYFEVGVLMALGVIIGIMLVRTMVGRWHT